MAYPLQAGHMITHVTVKIIFLLNCTLRAQPVCLLLFLNFFVSGCWIRLKFLLAGLLLTVSFEKGYICALNEYSLHSRDRISELLFSRRSGRLRNAVLRMFKHRIVSQEIMHRFIIVITSVWLLKRIYCLLNICLCMVIETVNNITTWMFLTWPPGKSNIFISSHISLL